MEPPDPSFADESNVPQEGAVLVFDVHRAAVSLPFQVYRLKVLVEAGLVAFSSACFEFANEVPKEAQHGSLAHLPKVRHDSRENRNFRRHFHIPYEFFLELVQLAKHLKWFSLAARDVVGRQCIPVELKDSRNCC